MAAPKRRRAPPPKPRSTARTPRSTKTANENETHADIYSELLSEATAPHQQDYVSERPRKRRRAGRGSTSPGIEAQSDHASDMTDAPSIASVARAKQTVYNDSASSDASEDESWEEVQLLPEGIGPTKSAVLNGDFDEAQVEDISLVLDKREAKSTKRTISKRVPSTVVEKAKRLSIHKIHVSCLLMHVYFRNAWCNLPEVQNHLRHVLSQRTRTYLKPVAEASQFQRSRSFHDGLQQAIDAWKLSYRISKRGLRRPIWTLEPGKMGVDNLLKLTSPEDVDPAIDRTAFIDMARNRNGSRDIGAQLFCALLRSAHVEARLACSLQPLSFAVVHVAPLTASKPPIKKTIYRPGSDSEAHVESHDELCLSAVSRASSVESTVSASGTHRIKRFGQSSTSSVLLDLGQAPIVKSPTRKKIKDSPCPIYWVEAFDTAIQKWIPVDPHATGTIGKAAKLEPPASDAINDMSYVVAFDEHGRTRDVTRRYTKAYNAKTRRARVESTKDGARWWRKTLKVFDDGLEADHDQVENAELANKEASEPMPRNVQDFRDHPYYALERHLRRNEVVHPKREVGKISASKSSTLLESIYRRRDVKLVRSADRWYRLGREIRAGELPLKHAAKPRRRRRGRSTASDAHSNDDDEDDDDDARGAAVQATALYAESQTELYMPPPVLRRRVPRNAYGNLDVYVPSMIPAGGVHVRAPEAARAARRVAGGIDAADAVVGFEFRGRRGTAVVQGVVVAKEHREAVEAAVREIRREEVRKRVEKEGKEAVRLWRKFMKGLRIRQRIMGHRVDGVVEAEELEHDAESAAEGGAEVAGGFLPQQSVAVAPSTARAPQIQARTTERHDDEDDPNTPIRLKRALAEISDLEPSIPSPWDRPILAAAAVQTTPPPGAPPAANVRDSLRATDEQAGGFVRDDNESAVDFGGGGGGFVRSDPDGGEGGGGFVCDEMREADALFAEGDDDDGGGSGGGFVRDEEGPTLMTPSVDDERERRHTQRRERAAHTPPGDCAGLPDGSFVTHASLRGDTAAVVVTSRVGESESLAATASSVPSGEDGERDEGEVAGNEHHDDSAAESLLSHDPDDDEAEPDWIV